MEAYRKPSLLTRKFCMLLTLCTLASSFFLWFLYVTPHRTALFFPCTWGETWWVLNWGKRANCDSGKRWNLSAFTVGGGTACCDGANVWEGCRWRSSWLNTPLTYWPNRDKILPLILLLKRLTVWHTGHISYGYPGILIRVLPHVSQLCALVAIFCSLNACEIYWFVSSSFIGQRSGYVYYLNSFPNNLAYLLNL